MECIFRIVTASKIGGGGGGGGGGGETGWMTRPLFVTGPGLLGDVWRSVRWGSGGDINTVPNSYATMIPYFRLYFEGNGIISYYIEPNAQEKWDVQRMKAKSEFGKYLQLLKVYDEYLIETAGCSDVPHYTVLWSRGVVWRGGPSLGGGTPGDGL